MKCLRWLLLLLLWLHKPHLYWSNIYAYAHRQTRFEYICIIISFLRGVNKHQYYVSFFLLFFSRSPSLAVVKLFVVKPFAHKKQKNKFQK